MYHTFGVRSRNSRCRQGQTPFRGSPAYDAASGGLVAKSCLTLCQPRTIAHQAPLSMEFSRQEYWSGLPFPSPRDLPDPGVEPSLLHCRQSPALQVDSLPLNHHGSISWFQSLSPFSHHLLLCGCTESFSLSVLIKTLLIEFKVHTCNSEQLCLLRSLTT